VTLEWRQVGSLDSIRLSYGRPNEGALIVAAGITASTNYEIRITPETEPERIETPSAWRQITSGALQTAVAGSITGQGVLATRNFVQLGTSANLMFAENGSTVLTNATVITAQGTAASITGQGSLATRNSVDLATADVVNKTGNNIQYSAGIGGGSLDSLRPAQVNADRTAVNTAAAISGQGTLATRNGVQLGSTAGVMYQENGTTVLTNASVVTSLGTAAGIVGQGPLATASLVATANIANAAVTNSSAFSGGVVFLTANAWHDIAEVNITSSGGSIDIIGLASVFLSDSDANLNIEMQIVRDAAVVNASGTVAQAVFYASGTLNIYRAIGTGALGALDVPASGLRTYRLQIRGNSSGIAPTFAIYSRSLRCLELKR
jgi:hypothetical protein